MNKVVKLIIISLTIIIVIGVTIFIVNYTKTEEPEGSNVLGENIDNEDTTTEVDDIPEEPKYKEITDEDLKLEMDNRSNIIILDVRTQREHDESHIPNSMLIPVNELEDRALEELTDKNIKIVVYCAAGSRTITACETLIDLGYTNVYKLNGGISGWKYEVNN